MSRDGGSQQAHAEGSQEGMIKVRKDRFVERERDPLSERPQAVFF